MFIHRKFCILRGSLRSICPKYRTTTNEWQKSKIIFPLFTEKNIQMVSIFRNSFTSMTQDWIFHNKENKRFGTWLWHTSSKQKPSVFHKHFSMNKTKHFTWNFCWFSIEFVFKFCKSSCSHVQTVSIVIGHFHFLCQAIYF